MTSVVLAGICCSHDVRMIESADRSQLTLEPNDGLFIAPYVSSAQNLDCNDPVETFVPRLEYGA